MSGNSFGKALVLTTFGESHGAAVGGVIDGLPANLEIDTSFIQSELNRRRPGLEFFSSPRKEEDTIEILSGIYNGKTTGAPIGFLVYNRNQNPADYDHLKDIYRPSHADFTYQQKYGIRDPRGGGRSSARETVARVAAGGFAKLLLLTKNIRIHAWISQIGPYRVSSSIAGFDHPDSEIPASSPRPDNGQSSASFTEIPGNVDSIGHQLSGNDGAADHEPTSRNQPDILSRNQPDILSRNQPDVLSRNQPEVLSRNQPDVLSRNQPEVLSRNQPEVLSRNQPDVLSRNQPDIPAGDQIINDPVILAYLKQLKDDGDTTGGVITCSITGVPAGLGEPVFDKLHADLAKAMLSINAVKGFEYGSGFKAASMKGSEHNDRFINQGDRITTLTNHSGGIQGGISNGEEIYFSVAFKPVSTLMQRQETVNTAGETVALEGKGRHDVCVVPRALPIVEAMAALVIGDHLLRRNISGQA
jgi:chorismate synthase